MIFLWVIWRVFSFITLFRTIILLCGTNNITRKYQGMYCGILLIPHNIVMNMNNVMLPLAPISPCICWWVWLWCLSERPSNYPWIYELANSGVLGTCLYPLHFAINSMPTLTGEWLLQARVTSSQCILDKVFASFWYLTPKISHKNKMHVNDMHNLDFDM